MAKTTNTNSLFSQRTMIIMVISGVLLFVGSFTVALSNRSAGENNQANSYSPSALGHQAFIQLLNTIGIATRSSRYATLDKTRSASLLVIAEPPDRALTSNAVKKIMAAPNVLLILPKRQGDQANDNPDLQNPNWVSFQLLLKKITVQKISQKFIKKSRITRSQSKPLWRLTLQNIKPTVNNAQFIKSDQLTPLISSDKGIFVGQYKTKSGTLWVASDPDVFTNFGLGQGDNAVFATRVIETIRQGDGPVIFDEILHGFEILPNFWGSMFQIPFLIATITAIISIAILLWAASGRFGPARSPKPALAPGKTGLIETTVHLLSFGSFMPSLMLRYINLVTGDIKQDLNAPTAMTPTANRQWIEQLEKTHNTTIKIAELTSQIHTQQHVKKTTNAKKIMSLTRDIILWKQEILNGSKRR